MNTGDSNYIPPYVPHSFTSRNKKISNYSKGMKQRIGLLSSILHAPKLLILDEPLSGLDPVGRATFKEVIKEINKGDIIEVNTDDKCKDRAKIFKIAKVLKFLFI